MGIFIPDHYRIISIPLGAYMILLILSLLIVPFFLGQPVSKIIDRGSRDVTDTYICGVMTMFVLSGALHFFVMFTNRPFSEYVKLYPVVIAFLMLVGVVITVFGVKKNSGEHGIKAKMIAFGKVWFKSGETKLFAILTLITLFLCVIRILTGEPDVTGDFTLETIRTTLQTDTIYQYNSFTGMLLAEGMPIRQQILTMPFYLAFLSEFFGVGVELVIYRVFPCFVLLMGFLVYTRLAGVLFPENKEKQTVFMFVICFMILVGDYAHAAPAALMLHQGFTGNALCVGVVIPFVIYACLRRNWLMAALCVAAELFLIWTTYGLGFSALTIFIFAFMEIVGKIACKSIGKQKV